MGNPQKSRPIAGEEKITEAAGIQKSAPSQPIVDQLGDYLDGRDGQKSATPRDAASYVHEMAIELKGIAESARLSFLAHLLHLPIEESAAQMRGRL